MLGKDAPQIGRAGFGATICLFAGPAYQLFFAHGHTGGVGAYVQDGGITGAGLGWALLPSLSLGSNSLHYALDLAPVHVDAAGIPEVVLGLLVAGLVGPLQADQLGQRRGTGPFQTQSRIGRIMPLFLARVVVVIALEREGTKDALHLKGLPALAVLARPGLVGRVDLVGGSLEEKGHQLVGRL